MDHQDWRAEAAHSLSQPNYPPRKLVLIYASVMIGVSLVLSLVSHLLGVYADSLGGLSAMGAQTIIASLQLALPLLTLVVQPFWDAGLQRAALDYGANRSVEAGNLLAGFHRWKPILTSSLMVGFLYVGRVFIASFLSTQILSFTPLVTPIYEASLKQMEDPSLDLLTLLGDSANTIMLVYGFIFLVVFVALALPLHYRYRMVNYILLQQPQAGGMQAMFVSRAMTQGRRKVLFKLDLSFWWFYLLEMLIAVLCYGDLILPLLGITLPISAEAASWLFLLLSMAAQLGLYCFARPMLEVSWARAFYACCIPDQPENPVQNGWQDV